MIRIVAVVYISDVALVTDMCNEGSTWRGAVHVAPRFAPNGAETAPRGAARRRTQIRASCRTAYNASQTQTHAEPRDSMPTARSRVRPVVRGRAD